MQTEHVHHERRIRSTLMTVLMVALIAATSLVGWPAERSVAATPGPGLHIGPIGHVGSFRLDDGTLAYCVEVAMYQPLAEQSGSARLSHLPAYTGVPSAGASYGFHGPQVIAPAVTDPVTMSRLNYILSRWGDTADNEQAVAVALAVFGLRGDDVGLTDHFIATVRNNGGESAYQRSVSMLAEAIEHARPPRAAVPAPPPTIDVDERGRGTVSYGTGTKTLRLENAVFQETGGQSLQVSGEGTVAIRGVRPAGWDAAYDIIVHADWESGTDGYAGEIWMHSPSVQGQQRIASGTGVTTGKRQEGTVTSTHTVTNTWWPRVSTQVTDRFVPLGGSFIDVVSVTAHPDGGDWTRDADGTYLPLELKGTLYGPLESDPTAHPLDEAPADAPVAAEVSLRVDDGPGDYEVKAPLTAIHSGYYTWVWRALWEDQDASVTHPPLTGVPALDATHFPVTDRFGEAAETHIVPQRLTMVTKIKEGTIGRGWSVTDQVAVHHEAYGGWLTEATGASMPVVLRGTLYHVSEEPTRALQAPADAQIVSEIFVEAEGPEIITTEAIPIPAMLDGWVVMQWCIRDDDQPDELRGVTREWCDDFAVPDETARIETPRVETLAVPEVTQGDAMTDVARVTGLIPHGAAMEFVAYLYPEIGEPVFDETWTAVGEETWTAEAIERLGDGRCTAQPVAVTERVPVLAEGEMESPEIQTRSSGTIHWVERLWAVDPITGEDVLIHEGECGLSEETTIVHAAPEPEPEQQTHQLAQTGGVRAVVSGGLGLGLLSIAAGLTMLLRPSRGGRSSDS